MSHCWSKADTIIGTLAISVRIIRNREKGGFSEGFFLQNVHLSWLWRSECQRYCWAQYPWYFCLLQRDTGPRRNPLG